MNTSEELFKQYSNLYQFEEGLPEYLIDKTDFQKALIDFTKSHVKAALESAHQNFQLPPQDVEFTLNCYPEEKIK